MTTTTATLDTIAPAAAEEPSRKAVWAARISKGLSVAFLTFDTAVHVLQPAGVAEASAELGWLPDTMFVIGLVQIACLILYTVPRTAVFGALLWTGYFGGAVATHARIGSPLFSHTLFPIYIAALLWLPLLLCDPRVRGLFGLRTTTR